MRGLLLRGFRKDFCALYSHISSSVVLPHVLKFRIFLDFNTRTADNCVKGQNPIIPMDSNPQKYGSPDTTGGEMEDFT